MTREGLRDTCVDILQIKLVILNTCLKTTEFCNV